MNQIVNIIPAPLKVYNTEGVFFIKKEIGIIFKNGSKELERIVSIFITYFGDRIKFIINPKAIESVAQRIELHLSTEAIEEVNVKSDDLINNLGEEGYALIIKPNLIKIHANASNGIFYGLQSVRQIFPSEFEDESIVSKTSHYNLPCCEIIDSPRFSWRGFMLDCCRHYWPVSYIKLHLDLLALQKFNIFHWHLTEDQGWRIEIKKYPKLTEIGSKRVGSQIGPGKDNAHDHKPHEGFYTQDEVKEIVAYAKERFIKVVPEIEMPGHSQAALAAYPELGCTSGAGEYKVGTQWGVYRDVYCGGKDAVYELNKKVLDEVMELFPSDIIHTGGDEVPKDRWKECTDCQAKIKKEGLKDEHALQCFFTNEISQYLADHGKRLMGWNEILDPDLVPNAICHYWTGKWAPIIKEMEKGRNVVVSKSSHLYLDHSLKSRPVSRVYNFEPILSEVDPKYHDKVLGVESPLWCECIFRGMNATGKNAIEVADYQVYPRLTALSEVAWTTKENRDLGSFFHRLEHFLPRLKILGINVSTLKEFEPNLLKRRKIKRLQK